MESKNNKYKQVIEWIRKEGVDYCGIFVGLNLIALGLVWFLIPNKIAAGGVSGLGIIFNYLWGWPVSLMILLFNIPLLLACLKVFGKSFSVKTIFGSLFLALAVEYWGRLAGPLTLDPLLASLFGGALAGIGMGVTFRYRGTTGGTDLVARLMNHYTAFSIGWGLLIVDGAMVALAGVVFMSLDAMLYTMIALATTSKTIDWVLEGLNYLKGALIISDHSEVIAKRILEEMGRGVTSLSGKGMYSGVAKEVLLCIVGRTEELRLKAVVKAEDPRAFVIITNIHEVLGEGFKE